MRNVPFAYRIDVQQGNVITQEMLAQLQPGMDKKKVNFIMGSPAIADTFHADRWDYIYTFERGHKRPEKRHVALFFENDKLVRVAGDVKAATGPIEIDTRQDQSVDVPDRKVGMLSKMANALPFVGGDTKKSDTDTQDDAKKAAPEVIVPDDAPVKKKKGFFARIFGRDDASDDEDTPSQR